MPYRRFDVPESRLVQELPAVATVTVVLPDIVPEVAIIAAVPAATPVARPLAFTVAIDGVSDDQVTDVEIGRASCRERVSSRG
jgi:hypothetical protein